MNGMTVPGHQPSDYSGGRIERVDIDSGKVEVTTRNATATAARPERHRLRPSGGFWFTDHGKVRERDRRTGVYYAKPDGSMIREAIVRSTPNGVGLSPAGRRCMSPRRGPRALGVGSSGPGQIKAGAELFTPAGGRC
jgi:gluconolactonase